MSRAQPVPVPQRGTYPWVGTLGLAKNNTTNVHPHEVVIQCPPPHSLHTTRVVVVSTLHTILAAAGSSLDPAGRLDSADKMHRRKGLNPRAGPVAGARQSALSCELSDKVIKVSVEHLRGGSHLCST